MVVVAKVKKIISLLFWQIANVRELVESDDECVTASEIYSCGREKEPGLVDAMFNSEKGNATLVHNILSSIGYYHN